MYFHSWHPSELVSTSHLISVFLALLIKCLVIPVASEFQVLYSGLPFLYVNEWHHRSTVCPREWFDRFLCIQHLHQEVSLDRESYCSQKYPLVVQGPDCCWISPPCGCGFWNPPSPKPPCLPPGFEDKTGLVNSWLDRLNRKMRLCAPYSCASAPPGAMLIGWPGHKRRKHRFPVAHTELPVCSDGRKANTGTGNRAQPKMAASRIPSQTMSSLGSSLLAFVWF